MSHWTEHLRRLSHLVKMYDHTMMLKPQFGSTAFVHHGHELLAGSQYAEFKMFPQKQVKLFCKDCKWKLFKLHSLEFCHWLFLGNWSLQMQSVSSYSFTVTIMSHVYYQATLQPEGLCQCKIPVTPLGIEPMTLRFIVQCLNQLHHCVVLCVASTVIVS